MYEAGIKMTWTRLQVPKRSGDSVTRLVIHLEPASGISNI